MHKSRIKPVRKNFGDAGFCDRAQKQYRPPACDHKKRSFNTWFLANLTQILN